MDSALEAHLEDLRVRWFSAALRKQAKSTLRRFFDHLGDRGIRDLRRVREADIVAYARALAETRTRTGRPRSVATRRSCLAAVQRFFRFLLREGVILRDPAIDVALPSWRRLPRAVLNQSQARRLVQRPNPLTVRGKRDRALLELLYGTAIRVGECERLDVAEVDLVSGHLFVRNGKGRRDRVTPILGRAADAVELYLRESRPTLLKDPSQQALFLTARGKRLPVKRIQDLVRSHARAAGIDLRVTPHTLRHGCATHLLQNGADVRHVQKLLGHARVETTAVYTRVTAEDLKEGVARAHPRERAWRARRRG